MDSRKNIRRRKEAERTRKNRVLIGYIEKNHPQIHKDACEYYEKLNKTYPYKLDLRRTAEYEMMCYNTTKRRIQTGRTQPGRKHQDNMVLTIPLIPQCTIQQPQPDQTPSPQPDQMPSPQPDQMPSPQSDQMPSPQPDQMPSPQSDQMPSPQPDQMPLPQSDQTPDNIPFPGLTNKEVNEIIRDLQQNNPGFQQWFQDIDIDIEIPDLSPLEVELS